MTYVISVLIVMVCGVLSVYGGVRCGFSIGNRIRTHTLFWIISAFIFMLATVMSAVAIAFQSLALTVLALGLLVGLLVGCKFGYGKNPGIWGMHDRFFLSKKDDVDKKRTTFRGVMPDRSAFLNRSQPDHSQRTRHTDREMSTSCDHPVAHELMSVDGRYESQYRDQET